MLIRQPARPLGRSTRCSSSSRSSSSASTSPHEPFGLLGAGLLAVGVVRRGEHVVGDVAHPSAVQAHGGVEQHQRRHQIRPGRGEIQRHRAAERMPDDHRRPASSSAASAADVGVDRPRRSPRRTAMAEQVRCGDREFGQVPRGQRLPPLPVPGEPVDGQDLYRPWRAVAVDVQIGHGIDVRAARASAAVTRCGTQSARRPAVPPTTSTTSPRHASELVGPPWCHFTHVRTAHRSDADSAHRTRNARRGASDRRCGHRQEHPADPGRCRAHRRGHRPGIGSAADGFGAARHAGARRHHVGTARRRAPARWSANRWSARCTRMHSRCCVSPRSARAIRRRG